jgi:hypothetical protein
MKASPIEKINPSRPGFRHYNAPEAEPIGKNPEENRFHAHKITAK